MVVVPALAKRQQRYPEAVPGIISSAKAPSSPHMRSGVDQPGRVEPDYRSKKNAPQNVTPPAYGEKQDGQDRDRHPVPTADPPLETVFAKLRHVGQKLCGILLHGLAGKNPAHVSPEAAIVGRMRITLFVRILVMHAMGCNPEERSAFKGQRAAHS